MTFDIEDVIKHAQTRGYKSDSDSRMLYMLAAEVQRLRAHVAPAHRLPPGIEGTALASPLADFSTLALSAANELDRGLDSVSLRELGCLMVSRSPDLPDHDELMAFVALFETLGEPRASTIMQVRDQWEATGRRFANGPRPDGDGADRLRHALLTLHGALLDLQEASTRSA